MPKWANLQASAITRADVRSLIGRVEAPVMANLILAHASAIFSWAIKQELLATNPCRGVDRNPTRSRERILSDAEIPQLWRTFDSAGFVASSALKLILLTGQRPGEVAHMRREHIIDSWWELPGEPVPALGWPGTKNAQSHRVWLPEAARRIIDDIGDGEEAGFVFGGARGRPVRKLADAMREICKRLGITD